MKDKEILEAAKAEANKDYVPETLRATVKSGFVLGAMWYRDQLAQAQSKEEEVCCWCGKPATVKTTHNNGVTNFQCEEHDVYNQAQREYLEEEK